MLYCKMCGKHVSLDKLPEELPEPVCQCHTLDEPDVPHLAENVRKIVAKHDPDGSSELSLDIGFLIQNTAFQILAIRERKWQVQTARDKRLNDWNEREVGKDGI